MGSTEPIHGFLIFSTVRKALIQSKISNFLLNFALLTGLRVHSVCFINNVYKQRFFQLVKIFQNLNNRTSQNLYVKQRMNQMKTRIQFSSGPSSIFRLAVRFQQIIFFRHHKCRMQISVPILTLINTNPSQVSFILLPSIK